MTYRQNLESSLIRICIIFGLLAGIVCIVCLETYFILSTVASSQKIINLLQKSFKYKVTAHVDAALAAFGGSQSLKPEIINAIQSDDFFRVRKGLRIIQDKEEIKSIALVLEDGRVISGGKVWILFRKIFDSGALDQTTPFSFFSKESNSYILVEPIHDQSQVLGHFIAQMNFDPIERILANYQREIENNGFRNSSTYFRNSHFFTGKNLLLAHFELFKEVNDSRQLKYMSSMFLSQTTLKMPDGRIAFMGCLIPEGQILKSAIHSGLISGLILCLMAAISVIYLRRRLKIEFKPLKELLLDASDLTKSSLDKCQSSEADSLKIVDYLEEQSEALEAVSVLVSEFATTSTHLAQRARDLLETVNETSTRSTEQLDLSESNCEHLAELCTLSKTAQGLTNAIRTTSNKIDLVAINASVEAFRAGTRGHDFANVTQEIDSLAQNAMEQSLQVDQTITEILRGATAGFNQSSLITNQIANTYDELQALKRHLGELAAETRKQSAKILEMNQLFRRKDRHVKRNHQTTEQSMQNHKNLVQQMLDLEQKLESINSIIEDNNIRKR